MTFKNHYDDIKTITKFFKLKYIHSMFIKNTFHYNLNNKNTSFTSTKFQIHKNSNYPTYILGKTYV